MVGPMLLPDQKGTFLGAFSPRRKFAQIESRFLLYLRGGHGKIAPPLPPLCLGFYHLLRFILGVVL